MEERGEAETGKETSGVGRPGFFLFLRVDAPLGNFKKTSSFLFSF